MIVWALQVKAESNTKSFILQHEKVLNTTQSGVTHMFIQHKWQFYTLYIIHYIGNITEIVLTIVSKNALGFL